MTPERMRDRAIELFTKRMHCSQAVLAAAQEKLGIDEPAVIKAVGAFGGGVASSGNICGSLLGGIAAISQVHSKAGPDEKESPQMWTLSFKLRKKFAELTEEFGSQNCRDIAKVDWRDRDQVKEFYTNPEGRRTHCIKLVGQTAQALGELLDS